METAAPGGRQRLGQRGPDQRMREAVMIGTRLLDQTGPQGLVQRIEQGFLGDVSQRGEDFDIDVATQHGRQRQELDGRFGKAADPSPDDVAHAFGNGRGDEVGQRPARPAPLDGRGLRQVAQHLLQEERIALGLGV